MSAELQLDIFGVLEEVALDRPPLCLYHSPARGLPARAAEFEAWRKEHGSFGSRIRSHAWIAVISDPASPAVRCQSAVLSCDIRDDGDDLSCDCTSIGLLLYRGACRGCTWEALQPREDENAAAEDALDHAWSGWRDLPVMPGMPGDPKKLARWTADVSAAYPAGWLEAAGPVRTWRQGLGTRHVPGRSPWGGYDVGVPEAAAEAAA
jgi:Family of unknown function (DUF6349)